MRYAILIFTLAAFAGCEKWCDCGHIIGRYKSGDSYYLELDCGTAKVCPTDYYYIAPDSTYCPR